MTTNKEADIDIKELRRRWTIELNSLGRRNNPSQEQAERKRDLQIFLCFIDPLRKYEQDWQHMKGLENKLISELVLQSSVSTKQYKDNFYTSLLIAMTGQPVANPSSLCEFNLRVRNLCEDHGENLSNVLEDMHVRNYVRKDYKTGEYSVSTVGSLLMERNSTKKLKNRDTGQATSMFNAISKHMQEKLGELHVKLNISSYDASIRKLSSQEEIKGKLKEKSSNPIFISKDVVPRNAPKVIDPLAVLADLKNRNTSATSILMILVQKQIVTIRKQEDTVYDPVVAPSIWTSKIEIEELPNVVFSGEGPNRKTSKQIASKKIIDHLWIKYSQKEKNKSPIY